MNSENISNKTVDPLNLIPALQIDLVDPFSLDLVKAIQLTLEITKNFCDSDSTKTDSVKGITTNLENWLELQLYKQNNATEKPKNKGKRALNENSILDSDTSDTQTSYILSNISALMVAEAKYILDTNTKKPKKLGNNPDVRISDFIADEGTLCLNIALVFRPILVDLTSRLVSPKTKKTIIELIFGNSGSNEAIIQYNFCLFYTFGLLFDLCPQVIPVIDLFLAHSEGISTLSHYSENSDGLSTILLLFVSRLSELILNQKHLTGANENQSEVVYLACQCLGKLYKMNDGDMRAFEKKWVINYGNSTSSVEGSNVDTNRLSELSVEFFNMENSRMQVENLKLIEHNKKFNNGVIFDTFKQNSINEETVEDGKKAKFVSKKDLCGYVVDIYGVLLPCIPNELNSVQTKDSISENNIKNTLLSTKSKLVGTLTAQKILTDLALAISLHQPVLLSGPSGSGKTSAVEEMAKLTGNELITIHLGDQTDPKVLLGTYVTGAKQGDFEWQPGVLTLAVSTGRWVLVEDIDKASSDVVSILLPLLESRELFIAGRGDRIKAHSRFQLIATQTKSDTEISNSFLASQQKMSQTDEKPTLDEPILGPDCLRLGSTNGREAVSTFSFSGSGISANGCWNRVSVASMTSEELICVVSEKHANLSKISTNLVEIYEKMLDIASGKLLDSMELATMISSISNGGSSRKLNVRDFFKWCKHISHQVSIQPVYNNCGFDLMQSVDGRFTVFAEAVDCFLASESNVELFKRKLHSSAKVIGVSNERVEYYLAKHVPKISINRLRLNIGRACLPISAGNYKTPENNSNSFENVDNIINQLQKKSRRPFALTEHARKLMEKIAVSAELGEAVLLPGETGTGKTTIVQYVADMVGQKLAVVNLSQQSDSSDLLGGFRPIDTKTVAVPLKDSFDDLFTKSFSAKKNSAFLDAVRLAFVKQNWSRLAKLFVEASKMAFQANKKKKAKLVEKLDSLNNSNTLKDGDKSQTELDFIDEHIPASPAKKLKTESLSISSTLEEKQDLLDLINEINSVDEKWKEFQQQANRFVLQVQDGDSRSMVFSYTEGALVKAAKEGTWILLDEINLATAETLDCLSGLLQDENGSILLHDRGDVKPIKRHPNFRLFACMNPATDVGKKALPLGLRSRFSEFYVQPPDSVDSDLISVIERYLEPALNSSNRVIIHAIKDFYRKARKLAEDHKLADGAQKKPNYSLRTLTRSLSFAAQNASTYSLVRSVYDGLYMTFATQLDVASRDTLVTELKSIIFKGTKPNSVNSLLKRVPQSPLLLLSQSNQKSTITTGNKAHTFDKAKNSDTRNATNSDDDNYVLFGSFWLKLGNEPRDKSFETGESAKYVLTNSVLENLYALSRAVMCGEYPVLIQGPTSAGKTSMVEYLAKKTRHKFVRVNNHEHTDLQEYVGSYVVKNGKLVFQEGVLVQALRYGHWLVLDELNLAPSDVLEALNRLLDDNRELLIPETNETVRPHKDFMLFATQNPAGLYGGRKHLSRAFRNRFLELHFDQIPKSELDVVLTTRCVIAPSHSKKLVEVYSKLTELRSQSRMFEAHQGFITLRDLFRWAGRGATTHQELAEVGYMLLAERIRKPGEKVLVKEVLEKVFRAKIDPSKLYSMENLSSMPEFRDLINSQTEETQIINDVVWTFAMRRLFVLSALCIRFNEPVLMVGETGCGKTTVCQLLAISRKSDLFTLNCHQNTETADLLGGQRPVRNRSEHFKKSYELSEYIYDVILSLKMEELLVATDIESENDILASRNSGMAKLIVAIETVKDKAEFKNLVTSDEFGSSFYDLLSRITHSDKDIFTNRLKLLPEMEKIFALIKESLDSYQMATSLFEWVDGPLVRAMKSGSPFLLDEISLADDSVLERLNSVLEPSRTLLLAEKSVDLDNDTKKQSSGMSMEIVADSGFKFMATMNPGGDYGKRELSPALRNRFVELWVPSVTNSFDLFQIIKQRMSHSKSQYILNADEPSDSIEIATRSILTFMNWFTKYVDPTTPKHKKKALDQSFYIFPQISDSNVGEEEGFNLMTYLSLREYLAWADFVAKTRHLMSVSLAVVHGGCSVVLDGLGTHGAVGGLSSNAFNAFVVPKSPFFKQEISRKQATKLFFVENLMNAAGVNIKELIDNLATNSLDSSVLNVSQNMIIQDSSASLFGIIGSQLILKQIESTMNISEDKNFLSSKIVERKSVESPTKEVGVNPFYIPTDSANNMDIINRDKLDFAFHAPTSFDNLVKILRGMQIRKPLLLEGSPGVGKTTLVEALAKFSGHKLERINLSDQTDLMDLFGTDLPVENGQMGQFEWRDAPFLKAMQNGDWVLLDEINLATQSVLEGLNSCLDHRGVVYISELGKEFYCHPNFYLFAAQNPVVQGGGRKGLPKSFLSRFTQVFMDELTGSDMLTICINRFKNSSMVFSESLLSKALEFNSSVQKKVVADKNFGRSGSPWEFNLRDVYRWLEISERLSLNGRLSSKHVSDGQLIEFIRLIFVDRMRTHKDRNEMWKLIEQIFLDLEDNNEYIESCISVAKREPSLIVSSSFIQVGNALINRSNQTNCLKNKPSDILPSIDGMNFIDSAISSTNKYTLLKQNLPALSSLIHCINMQWMAVLVGSSGIGKSSMVQFLANSTGNKLLHFSMNSSVDTLELLGGFEKIDLQRHWNKLMGLVKELVSGISYSLLVEDDDKEVNDINRNTRLYAKNSEPISNSNHDDMLMDVDNEYILANGDEAVDTGYTNKQDLINDKKPLSSPEYYNKVVKNAKEMNQQLELATLQKPDTKKILNIVGLAIEAMLFVYDASVNVKLRIDKMEDIKEYKEKLVLLLMEKETSNYKSQNRVMNLYLDLLEKIHLQIVKYSELERNGVLGRFEFVDGVLIDALVNGYWLLVDKANLCSPSVLDRLNGLLEPNGVLTLGECGLVEDVNGNQVVRTIRKHENFRIILTVDPKYGELSRAMRNRGIEISMIPPKKYFNKDKIVESSFSDIYQTHKDEFRHNYKEETIDSSSMGDSINSINSGIKEIALEDDKDGKKQHSKELSTIIYNMLKSINPILDYIHVARLHQLLGIEIIVSIFGVACELTGCRQYYFSSYPSRVSTRTYSDDTNILPEANQNKQNNSSEEKKQSANIPNSSSLLRCFVQLCLQAMERLQRGGTISYKLLESIGKNNYKLVKVYSREIQSDNKLSSSLKIEHLDPVDIKNLTFSKREQIIAAISKLFGFVLDQSGWKIRKQSIKKHLDNLESNGLDLSSLFIYFASNNIVPTRSINSLMENSNTYLQILDFFSSLRSECELDSINNRNQGLFYNFEQESIKKAHIYSCGIASRYQPLSLKPMESMLTFLPGLTVTHSEHSKGLDELNTLILNDQIRMISNDPVLLGIKSSLYSIRLALLEGYPLNLNSSEFICNLPTDIRLIPEISILLDRVSRNQWSRVDSRKFLAKNAIVEYISKNLTSIHDSLTSLLSGYVVEFNINKLQKAKLTGISYTNQASFSKNKNTVTVNREKGVNTICHLHMAYRYNESDGTSVSLEQLAHPALAHIFPLLSYLNELTRSYIFYLVSITSETVPELLGPEFEFLLNSISESYLDLSVEHKYLIANSEEWNSFAGLVLKLSDEGNILFECLETPRSEPIDLGRLSAAVEQISTTFDSLLNHFEKYKNLDSTNLLGSIIGTQNEEKKHLKVLEKLNLNRLNTNQKFRQSIDRLNSELYKISASLDIGSNKLTRNLWQLQHAVVLPTEDLKQLEKRFIASFIHLLSLAKSESMFSKPKYRISSIARDSDNIIQALATLYTLTNSSSQQKTNDNSSLENPPDAEDLISKLEQLVTKIESVYQVSENTYKEIENNRVGSLSQSSGLSNRYRSLDITQANTSVTELSSFTHAVDKYQFENNSFDVDKFRAKNVVSDIFPLYDWQKNSKLVLKMANLVGNSSILILMGLISKNSSKITQEGGINQLLALAKEIENMPSSVDLLYMLQLPKAYYFANNDTDIMNIKNSCGLLPSIDNLTTNSDVQKEENARKGITVSRPDIKLVHFLLSCLQLRWYSDSLETTLATGAKSTSESGLQLTESNIQQIQSFLALEPELILFYNNNLLNFSNYKSISFPENANFRVLDYPDFIEKGVSINVSAFNTGFFASPSTEYCVSDGILIDCSKSTDSWKWPLYSKTSGFIDNSIWIPSTNYLVHLFEHSPISIFSETATLSTQLFKQVLLESYESGKRLIENINYSNNTSCPNLSYAQIRELDAVSEELFGFISINISHYLSEYLKLYFGLFGSRFFYSDYSNIESEQNLVEVSKNNYDIFKKEIGNSNLTNNLLITVTKIQTLIQYTKTSFDSRRGNAEKLKLLFTDFTEISTKVYKYLVKTENSQKENHYSSGALSTIYQLGNMAFIKSSASVLSAIDSYCYLYKNSYQRNEFYVNKCQSMICKSLVEISLSVLISLVPSNPVDPASKTLDLLEWSVQSMISQNFNFMISSVFNNTYGSSENSSLQQHYSKMVKENILESNKLSSQAVFRRKIGSLESPSNSNKLSFQMNKNHENSIDIVSNNELKSKEYSFSFLWLDIKKMMDNILNPERISNLLNELFFTFENQNGSNSVSVSSFSTMIRTFNKAKDSTLSIEKSLRLGSEKLSQEYDEGFRDLVLLWNNRIDSIRLNLVRLASMCNPNIVFENPTRETILRLIGKELIIFPESFTPNHHFYNHAFGRVSGTSFDLSEEPDTSFTNTIDNLRFLASDQTLNTVKYILKLFRIQIQLSAGKEYSEIVGSNSLISNSLDGSENPIYLKYLVHILSRISVSVLISKSLDLSMLNLLNSIFGEIYTTWRNLDELRQKQQAERDSLYKKKSKAVKSDTLKDISDVERSDLEFSEWFPSFEKEFEIDELDILNDSNEGIKKKNTNGLNDNDSDDENDEVGNIEIPELDSKMLSSVFSIHKWVLDHFNPKASPTNANYSEISETGLSEPNENVTNTVDSIAYLLKSSLGEGYQLSSEIGGKFYALIENNEIIENIPEMKNGTFDTMYFRKYVDEIQSAFNLTQISALLKQINDPEVKVLSISRKQAEATAQKPTNAILESGGISSKSSLDSSNTKDIKNSSGINIPDTPYDDKSNRLQLRLGNSWFTDTTNPVATLVSYRLEDYEFYDFYHSSNYSQAQLIYPTVNPLMVRVENLLDEYNDNAVLEQIRKLCTKIIRLPINTPIAKLLSGIESLLQRATDWENYNSSKATSVQLQLDIITKQIVKWRQIELYSWPTLMKIEFKNVSQKSYQYWFNMFSALVLVKHFDYDSIVRLLTNTNQCTKEDINTAISLLPLSENDVEPSSIIEIVDRLLQTCAIGEFHGRLQLLKTFSKHRSAQLHLINRAKKLIKLASSLLGVEENVLSSPQLKLDNESFTDRILSTLESSIQYYSQFSSFLDTAIKDNRLAISRELAEYVKISSFSDVNPISLKLSAKRTHLHLAKCLRKWRDYLMSPVNQIIENHIKSHIQAASLDSFNNGFAVPNSNNDNSIPSKSGSIESLLNIFSTYSTNSGCSSGCITCKHYSILWDGKSEYISSLARASGLENLDSFITEIQSLGFGWPSISHLKGDKETDNSSEKVAKLSSKRSKKIKKSADLAIKYLKNYWNLSNWKISRVETNPSSYETTNLITKVHSRVINTLSTSSNPMQAAQFLEFEKWNNLRNNKVGISKFQIPEKIHFWNTPFPNPLSIVRTLSSSRLEKIYSKMLFGVDNDSSNSSEYLTFDSLVVYIKSLSKEVKHFQSLTTPPELLNKAEKLLKDAESKKQNKSKSSKTKKSKAVSLVDAFTGTKIVKYKGTLKVVTSSKKEQLSTNDNHHNTVNTSNSTFEDNEDVQMETNLLETEQNDIDGVVEDSAQLEDGETSSDDESTITKAEAMEIQNKAIKSYWSQQKQLRQKLLIDTIKQFKKLGLNPNTKITKDESANEKKGSSLVGPYELSGEIEKLDSFSIEDYVKSIHQLDGLDSENLILTSSHASFPLLVQSDKDFFEHLTYLHQAHRAAYYLNNFNKSTEKVTGRNEITQQQIDRLFGMTLHWSQYLKDERNVVCQMLKEVTQLNNYVSLFYPTSVVSKVHQNQNSIPISTNLLLKNSETIASEGNIIMESDTLKTFIDKIVEAILKSITGVKTVTDALTISKNSISKSTKSISFNPANGSQTNVSIDLYGASKESILNDQYSDLIESEYGYRDCAELMEKLENLLSESLPYQKLLTNINYKVSSFASSVGISGSLFFGLLSGLNKNSKITEDEKHSTSLPPLTVSQLLFSTEFISKLKNSINEISIQHPQFIQFIQPVQFAVNEALIGTERINDHLLFEKQDVDMENSDLCIDSNKSIRNPEQLNNSILDSMINSLVIKISVFGNAVTVSMQNSFKVLDSFDQKTTAFSDFYRIYGNTEYGLESSPSMVDEWNLHSNEVKSRVELFQSLYNSLGVVQMSNLLKEMGEELGELFNKIAWISHRKNESNDNATESKDGLKYSNEPDIKEYADYVDFLVKNRIHPLINQYHRCIQHIVNSLSQQHYQFSDCGRVFTQLMASVFTRGIASNDALTNHSNVGSEEEEDDSVGSGKREGEFDTDAAGMGEGSTEGAKNVSNEIENEDQVLGATQKDKEEPQEKNNDPISRNEDSIEMEADFEGEIGEADLEQVNQSVDKGSTDQEMVAKDEDDEAKDGDNGDDTDKSKEDGKSKNKEEKQRNDPSKQIEDNEDEGDENDEEGKGSDGEENTDDLDNNEPNGMGSKLPIADVENDVGEQMDLPDDLNLDNGNEKNNEEESNEIPDFEGPEDEVPDKKKGKDDNSEIEDKDGNDFGEEENISDPNDNANEANNNEDMDVDKNEDENSTEAGTEEVQDETKEENLMDQDENEKSENQMTGENVEDLEKEIEDQDMDDKGEGEDASESQKMDKTSNDVGEEKQSYGFGLDSGDNDDMMHQDQSSETNKNTDQSMSEAQNENQSQAKTEGGQSGGDQGSENAQNQNYNFDNSAQSSDLKPLSQSNADNNMKNDSQRQQNQPNRKTLQKMLEQQNNPLRSLADAMDRWEQKLNLIERDSEDTNMDSSSYNNEDSKNENNDHSDMGAQYQLVGENENHDSTAMADADIDMVKQQLDSIRNASEVKPDDENLDSSRTIEKDLDKTKENENDESDYKMIDEAESLENQNYNPVDNQENHESVKMESAMDRIKALSKINQSETVSENEENDNQQGSENENNADNPKDSLDESTPNKDNSESVDLMENMLFTYENAEKDDNENKETNLHEDNEANLDQLSKDTEDLKLGEQPKKVVDLEKLKEDLEQATIEWHSNGQDANDALALWNGYVTSSHENSMRLCEQLRLILEPTLASHLKGDYRTGKRLNMKRIIPYIASQYKRDKIWLRRTKPMKRQYQVMLAIDDSKSMASTDSNNLDGFKSGHAIRLTYETLALLTNSLQLLEVGETSIVSFGNEVKLLHPFGNDLSLDSGARIISQLKFNQEGTDIGHLLETAIGLFNPNALLNESIGGISGEMGNNDLWKLLLILSDGICQNHSQLKQLVRTAAEMRIMIVFIVLDRNPESNEQNTSIGKNAAGSSITDIKQVQYQTGKSGKLELVMTKYLDTFPFDFYVVLRSIDGLPEVLSDALRQFFALVGTE
ncbi:hypothetical protein BB558_001727 [Smittium angustum]|uniref:Midasin n=1 Tax=Smittium angustum TaxID=133377 RepID=A0A2U1JAI6_SMIAN|nr:hypothetical protein BB558_001727 [Smittium angustum]